MDELLGTRAQPERWSHSGSLCAEVGTGRAVLSPFLAPALFLRCASDSFSLTKPNTSCKIEWPAPLRSEGVRVHPGMPFGFPSETASASPESSAPRSGRILRYDQCALCGLTRRCTYRAAGRGFAGRRRLTSLPSPGGSCRLIAHSIRERIAEFRLF
jgi:hypothetical protein